MGPACGPYGRGAASTAHGHRSTDGAPGGVNRHGPRPACSAITRRYRPSRRSNTAGHPCRSALARAASPKGPAAAPPRRTAAPAAGPGRRPPAPAARHLPASCARSRPGSRSHHRQAAGLRLQHHVAERLAQRREGERRRRVANQRDRPARAARRPAPPPAGCAAASAAPPAARRPPGPGATASPLRGQQCRSRAKASSSAVEVLLRGQPAHVEQQRVVVAPGPASGRSASSR